MPEERESGAGSDACIPGTDHGGHSDVGMNGSLSLIPGVANHVGFGVEKDGTAGKVYVDLEGGVTGITFVHVSSCQVFA